MPAATKTARKTRAPKTAAVAPKTPKGRKGRMPLASVRPEETKLVQKYPAQRIVVGSWMPSGGVMGNKASVEILCQKCGTARRIATSDVFQVKTCSMECKKAIAKEAKAAAAK